MRDGHYTAGDIEGLTITPADKKKHTVQTAHGKVDGVLLWSNGIDYAIGEGAAKKSYSRIEKVPAKYVKVAEIIRKKALGRGGHRLGAGRPKETEPQDEKKMRSFRLTDSEYAKVKAYIKKIRIPKKVIQ